MNPELLLSLFPGADLLGRAFELEGCCVVRGPDLLFGHDIRHWVRPGPAGFEGIIGGPPCTPFTTLRRQHQPARHIDGVPIFWDIVRESRPAFAVMENVFGVRGHKAIPWSAEAIVLTDWDCGGLTSRTRVFYVWPHDIARCIVLPARRPVSSGRRPARAVLATSDSAMSAERAGELQGWPDIAETIQREADAGAKGNRLISKRFIAHMLGNGVPRAMGEWIAREVMRVYRAPRSSGVPRSPGDASSSIGASGPRPAGAPTILNPNEKELVQ